MGQVDRDQNIYVFEGHAELQHSERRINVTRFIVKKNIGAQKRGVIYI